MEQRARELSTLRPRSQRRDEREGPAEAGQHRRRRAGLAAAQSPPEPSPGRSERRLATAGARDRASEQGGGGPEKAADPSGGPRSGPAACASSWRIPVSAGGRVPASLQAWWPQRSLSPEPVARIPPLHHSRTGGSAVDVGTPGPGKELVNSLRSGTRFGAPSFFYPDRPGFRLRGGGRGGAGPAVGVDAPEESSPSPNHP